MIPLASPKTKSASVRDHEDPEGRVRPQHFKDGVHTAREGVPRSPWKVFSGALLDSSSSRVVLRGYVLNAPDVLPPDRQGAPLANPVLDLFISLKT